MPIPSRGSLWTRLLSILLLVGSASAWARKPEYDFHQDFRNSFVPKPRAENPLVAEEEILKEYSAKLRSEGIADGEIARRITLLRRDGSLLGGDYWNRFYSGSRSNFNRAPNGFLVQVVREEPPGVALDFGMGEGPNALHGIIHASPADAE